jgi:ribonuclease HI
MVTTRIRVVAIYADGGVIHKNPSPIGGTWAYCLVDEHDERFERAGGVVPATGGRLITNNQMEQIAIVRALEEMPPGWSGLVCSDSKIALGRVFEGWSARNLPNNVAKRSALAVARLGKIEPVLLQGHPTKLDLQKGIGARSGRPVSKHNVWCDKECQRQAKRFLKTYKEAEVCS